MRLQEVEEKLAELKALRGTQDQTMRCGVIRILYGEYKRSGRTPTERFLEDQISLLEDVLKADQP
jgi:hypothetical protein